jgi:hypothetical protein
MDGKPPLRIAFPILTFDPGPASGHYHRSRFKKSFAPQFSKTACRFASPVAKRPAQPYPFVPSPAVSARTGGLNPYLLGHYLHLLIDLLRPAIDGDETIQPQQHDGIRVVVEPLLHPPINVAQNRHIRMAFGFVGQLGSRDHPDQLRIQRFQYRDRFGIQPASRIDPPVDDAKPGRASMFASDSPTGPRPTIAISTSFGMPSGFDKIFTRRAVQASGAHARNS